MMKPRPDESEEEKIAPPEYYASMLGIENLLLDQRKLKRTSPLFAFRQRMEQVKINCSRNSTELRHLWEDLKGLENRLKKNPPKVGQAMSS